MPPGEPALPVMTSQAGGPLVVAHRGAWEAAPQNSLDALRAAIALGCDGIEIDVRRTSDGRLVLVHDARIGWRTVSRLEHHQVQARMRVGQAPLLQDVLELAAGRILVDIELKEDGYVATAMDAVTRHLTDDQYVITSFRPAVLAQVRAHAARARTGLLIGPGHRRDIARRLTGTGASFLAPHVSLIRSGMLEAPATSGLPLWVWTVNDDRSLRSLPHHPRVAALITDRPARAIELADQNNSPDG